MSGVLSRFRRDRRGVSAVEFALIAPVLITFYFGLAELTQAMMAERRAGHAAAAIGDLVAQSSSVTEAELDDIFKIAAKIIEPFPSTDLKMRVTSISQSAGGTKTLDWSEGSGMSGLTSVPTLPNGLIGNGQSVIISEVTYKYNSPVDYVVPNGISMAKTSYLRPRKSDKVALKD